MELREFNWEYAEDRFNPQHYLWIRMNYKTPLTKEDYVNSMVALKQYSTSPIKEKTYKPVNLRKEYKKLQKKYGFFK